MPVPFRTPPVNANTGASAAYLEVVWLPSARTFYGGLLIIDSRGRPLEFVYNSLEAPSGFLWPEDRVRESGVSALCHSLFWACHLEPKILLCRGSLGDPAYCRAAIAPTIPFAQISNAEPGMPCAWSWINSAPQPGSAEHALSENLRDRGLVEEPFARIRRGLSELFPKAPWAEAPDDKG